MTDRRMTSKPLLLSVLALASLAGCSQFQPYQRADQPLPATWPLAEAARVTPAQVQPLAWQAFVTDPVLRKLVDKALQNNRDLRIARLQIEQARAQHQIRQAAVLPTVNAGITGDRQAKGASEKLTSNFMAGFMVNSWEIDFFGRLASLRESALADYLATEEARKSTQISLVAAVVSGWLNLQASEAQLALTRQTLANRDEALRLTQLRFKYGKADLLELRLAEGLSESARAAEAQQERQRMLDLNALNLLLGQPVDQVLTAAELQPQSGTPEAAFAAVAEVPVGLPAQVLLQRPDIVSAEQKLAAAHARIGAARAAFFPNITLTAGVGTASTELSGLFRSGSTGWILTPQVMLPIFDGGANQANLSAAQAEQGMALAQYEKTIQTAFREVNDALAGQATLGRQLQAQQALVQAETERTHLTGRRVKQGVASPLEVLDVQRSLFAAQQDVLQTRLAIAQNRVALYKSLGGGWQDSAAQ